MSSPTGHKWSDNEHARFLEAMELYPTGSWKQRAAHVGTRTTRQVMTHAQKFALKRQRHARGLQKAGRPRRGSELTRRRDQRDTPATFTTVQPPPLPLRLSFVEMLEEIGEADMMPVGLELLDLPHVCTGPPHSPASPGMGMLPFDMYGIQDELVLDLPAMV